MPDNDHQTRPTLAATPHLSAAESNEGLIRALADRDARIARLEKERDTARKAHDAWREFAEHCYSCGICIVKDWTDCIKGRQLRAVCKAHDPEGWFPGDGVGGG